MTNIIYNFLELFATVLYFLLPVAALKVFFGNKKKGKQVKEEFISLLVFTKTAFTVCLSVVSAVPHFLFH